MNNQSHSFSDKLINALDQTLRALHPQPINNARPNPAGSIEDATLTEAERKHAAGLMRINHAGEVAAQGLYRGHAAVAREESTKTLMQHSAEEEIDHMAWCEQRLDELGSKPSVFRPVWYLGSCAIGAASGILGDRWSLGFMEETERQVAAHLQEHMQKLPKKDDRSRAILKTMRDEEISHGNKAHEAGANALPSQVQQVMGVTAKIMKTVAYRI